MLNAEPMRDRTRGRALVNSQPQPTTTTTQLVRSVM